MTSAIRATIRLVALSILLALESAPARAQATSAVGSSFTLGPGDVVRVKIWREKDLGGEFQVDEAGRLTLPLLGTRIVTGTTWIVLRDSLMAAYQHELKAPAVTLTPLRRVYVLGEVTKPGPYLADPTLSLAGIVALAGGASPLGDLHRVRVVRAGKAVIDNAPIEYQLEHAVIQSEDQIYVDRRGWFDRNSTFVATAALSLASIVVTLIRR